MMELPARSRVYNEFRFTNLRPGTQHLNIHLVPDLQLTLMPVYLFVLLSHICSKPFFLFSYVFLIFHSSAILFLVPTPFFPTLFPSSLIASNVFLRRMSLRRITSTDLLPPFMAPLRHYSTSWPSRKIQNF